jgi:hypothetical protein
MVVVLLLCVLGGVLGVFYHSAVTIDFGLRDLIKLICVQLNLILNLLLLRAYKDICYSCLALHVVVHLLRHEVLVGVVTDSFVLVDSKALRGLLEIYALFLLLFD